MNRRGFLRALALAAGGGALGCSDPWVGLYDDFEVNFSGRVLVVGAGAAGMASAYLLDRYGIDFEILEAAPRWGGRVRREDGLGDFPIDLGAEWIHHDPSILASLVDDRTVDGSVDLVAYAPQSIHSWNGDRIRGLNVGRNYYHEYKFKRTTWYGFLEQYFLPTVANRLVLNSPVTTIDTSGAGVEVHSSDGTVRTADRLILTAPVKVLQEDLIAFVPELSSSKREAIQSVVVPEGLKAFFEFDRRFYPDLLLDGPLLSPNSYQKLYYDAAFGKDSSANILGHLWVSDDARVLTDLPDDVIASRVLEALDEIFDGAATRHYMRHRVQNWSAEPFIRGAYSIDFDGSQSAIVDELRAPIDGAVYLAGEALEIDDQSTVHGAMLSGYRAVEQILRS